MSEITIVGVNEEIIFTVSEQLLEDCKRLHESIKKHVSCADELTKEGFEEEAKKYYDTANDLMDKFKTLSRFNQTLLDWLKSEES